LLNISGSSNGSNGSNELEVMKTCSNGSNEIVIGLKKTM
jgi:hypothetical protein